MLFLDWKKMCKTENRIKYAGYSRIHCLSLGSSNFRCLVPCSFSYAQPAKPWDELLSWIPSAAGVRHTKNQDVFLEPTFVEAAYLQDEFWSFKTACSSFSATFSCLLPQIPAYSPFLAVVMWMEIHSISLGPHSFRWETLLNCPHFGTMLSSLWPWHCSCPQMFQPLMPYTRLRAEDSPWSRI